MSETISFSFQDYLDYQEILNNSLENNSDTLFFNESYVHAAMVTKTLIDNAIKRDWGINMFCGEFSLFRNKFKEHIINIKENLKGDETALAKSDDFDKFDPYGDLIESLRSFFDKDLKLNVIIAHSIDGIENDELWSTLFYKNIKKRNLVFKKLNISIDFDHFIVSGNAFRLENSGNERTAICSINRPEYAKILQATFDKLNKLSSIIDCD
ncbi:MAG: hypothetical protein J6T81_01365 [Bacteroidales bacterium]|nr:hypothetical protein [Bacteroidales bacterium]